MNLIIKISPTLKCHHRVQLCDQIHCGRPQALYSLCIPDSGESTTIITITIIIIIIVIIITIIIIILTITCQEHQDWPCLAVQGVLPNLLLMLLSGYHFGGPPVPKVRHVFCTYPL